MFYRIVIDFCTRLYRGRFFTATAQGNLSLRGKTYTAIENSPTVRQILLRITASLKKKTLRLARRFGPITKRGHPAGTRARNHLRGHVPRKTSTWLAETLTLVAFNQPLFNAFDTNEVGTDCPAEAEAQALAAADCSRKIYRTRSRLQVYANIYRYRGTRTLAELNLKTPRTHLRANQT